MQTLKKFYFGKHKIYKGPLLNGLFAYYRLETNINDSLGLYNGITVGTVAYKPAKIYRGLEILTNPSGYAQIPHNSIFNFSNGTTDLPFTISFNIKRNVSKPTAYSCVMDKISSTSLPWIIRFYQNRLEVYMTGTSGGNFHVRQNNLATVGVFENYTVTYDASKSISGINIYRNGILEDVTRVATGTFGRLITNSRNVTIGVFGDSGSGGSTDGTIDDIAFWNRVLTTGEIIENFNRNVPLSKN